MNGPFISEMGDVVTSALNISEAKQAGPELRQNFRLETGQIERIYTVDDSENSAAGQQKIYTLYDVMVTRPNGATELIPRCRALQPLFGGGLNNFLEVLPNDPGPNALDNSVSKSLKRGHFVLVGFVSGRKDAAVILGALPHANKVAIGRRPKKGKGTYLESEVQGLQLIIDNDGALRVTFNGPRKDDGSLITQNGPTQIQIDKKGSITVSTNANQTIRIDRETRHIRIDNGPTHIDMDQNGDKIDVVAKNVNVGTGGLQPQIVGDDMVKFMEEFIDEVMALYVPTGVGPSGNPVNNPKFAALKAKCKDMIQSKKHKVEK